VRSTFEQISDREVAFTRLLDAAREIVWKALTEPRHLERWWGPNGFSITTHEFAFVPGGVWRFVMHDPAGTDNPNRVVFREIDPPSRLVYENRWDLPGWPLDFIGTITLVAVGPNTRLTIHLAFEDATAFQTAIERYGVLKGGTETLERIAECLQEG
jgi:uncharacterized protein YndB with AHSA1/START domain